MAELYSIILPDSQLRGGREVPISADPMPSGLSPTPPATPLAVARYCCTRPPNRTILSASPRGSHRDNRQNKRRRHRGCPLAEHPLRATQEHTILPAASCIQSGPHPV